MTNDHILLLLFGTLVWARHKLDQARAGAPVSSRVIDMALIFSGDLPLKGNKK
jgi:hypothetical protein